MLANAFSLNMLPKNSSGTVEWHPTSVDAVRAHVQEHGSAIGHADLAAVLSSVLGMEVPSNRTSISLEDGATLMVAQYHGPRLAEGTTVLPDGAEISFYKLTVEYR